MSFNTQIPIACLTLLVMPAIVALGVFFVMLRFWAIEILRKNSKICGHINLIVIKKGISWKINLNDRDLPWPSNSLEWATVAALFLILLETVLFGREAEARIFWYVAGVSAATIVLSAPFIISFLCANEVQAFVKGQFSALVSLRSREETDVVREIIGLEEEIFDSFAAIGVTTRIDPTKNCRDILLLRATGEAKDTFRRFCAVRKTLAAYLEELQNWVPLHEAARQEFDWAKKAVICNGSASLLDELDRLGDWMNSDRFAEFLDRGRWDEAHQLLNQIRFDLKVVQNAAEGGSDMPQSIEDAYRLLNVSGATSNKIIKGVVDALRRVWHPDLTSDATEREQRTAKMKQINAAWDIVVEARAENAELRPIPPESDRANSGMIFN